MRSPKIVCLSVALTCATSAAAAQPSAPVPVAAAPTPVFPPGATYHPDANGFIHEWLMLGPIFYDPTWPMGAPALDTAQIAGEASLRPKDGDKVRTAGQELVWHKHKAGDAYVDLAAATSTTETKAKLAYAVTHLVSDAAVKGARLRVGTDDLAKVWWNGKAVIRHEQTVGAAKRDTHGAFVDVKKGVNTLVMKVVNDEKKWGFYARVVGDGGKPVALKVAGAADGKGDLTSPDGEGFVRDWVVLGPIAYKPRPFALGQLAKQHIPNEAQLAPKRGAEQWGGGQPHRWTPWAAGEDGVLDFNAYMQKHDKFVPAARWEPNKTVFNPLGYAATYVYAPAAINDARVRIGVNDQGVLYVNGKRAAIWDQPGALVKDQAEGKVALKKGVNVLVLKVVNAGDNWQGAVRFVDKAGAPLTNLDVKLAPPPDESERALHD